jgi:hypothetical protein
MVSNVFSSRASLVVVCLLASAVPAVANEDVALALLPKQDERLEDPSADTLQIYRIPISFKIRSMEDHPFGIRVYIPLSLGTTRIEAVRDLEEFFTDISSAALIPGVEFLIPVGDRWVMKPFGELGVAVDSATDDLEVLYSLGFRARGEYNPKPFHVMFGGAYRYRNNTASTAVNNWFSTTEAGADAQLPLGFSLGKKEARGGAYVVVRRYSDLVFEIFEDDPVSIDWGYEAGLSFSTEPNLKLWIIRMPWIGIGYRWGDRTRGIRINFSFPF